MIKMPGGRSILIWLGLGIAVGLPIMVAAQSPLLAWRAPVYIVAGFAGVLSMALMLVQPLLAGGYLPGLPPRRGRRVHAITGVALVIAVLLHVAGLLITSPPDAIDALTLRAPTTFSYLGVLSMWTIFGAAALAVSRRYMLPRHWRLGHAACVSIAVVAGVGHALLIDGTMGLATKAILCALVIAATIKVMSDLRVWRLLPIAAKHRSKPRS